MAGRQSIRKSTRGKARKTQSQGEDDYLPKDSRHHTREHFSKDGRPRRNPTRAVREFPFLKLPPELRNRIYSLLFGGNAIHISRSGSNIHYSWFNDEDSITSDSDSDASDDDDATEERAVFFKRSNLSANHRELLFGTVGGAHFTQGRIAEDSLSHLQREAVLDYGAGLPVQLLRTCRQIHQEAALILYAENSFVFHQGLDANTREALETYLGPKQRQAIRSATILGVEHAHLQDVDEFLPGLKWIRAQITLYPLRSDPNTSDNDEAKLVLKVMEEECPKIKTALKNMTGLRLVGATVYLEPNGPWFTARDEDRVRLHLAGELEEVLLEGKGDREAGGKVDLEA